MKIKRPDCRFLTTFILLNYPCAFFQVFLITEIKKSRTYFLALFVPIIPHRLVTVQCIPNREVTLNYFLSIFCLFKTQSYFPMPYELETLPNG